MAAEDANGGLSLVEFHRNQRRKECIVCALPDEARQQMLGASTKKIRRSTVIAWLKEVHGAEITDVDLTSHYSGKHE